MNNPVRATFLTLVLVVSSAILVGCGGTAEPTMAPEATEAVVTVVETVITEVTATSLPTEAPEPTEAVVTVIETVVETVIVEVTATSAATASVQSQLAEIDRLLERTVLGNVAHNVPSTMRLDETIDIQLLLSPSLAAAELEQRIAPGDPVRTASVEITPQMQAELWADDPDAFDIHPYHADARQLVSSQEPTEWKWAITARKGGLQTLNLTLHRMVKYEGKDHWRQVQEYETTIQVAVTFRKWLAGLDWKFLVVTAIAVLGLPVAVWKLLGQRLSSLRGRLAQRQEQDEP